MEESKQIGVKYETEMYLSCNCHGEILKVEKFAEEDEYYLTVFKYKDLEYSFLERLKLAWKVFRGRGLNTFDIILSSQNFNKLRDF